MLKAVIFDLDNTLYDYDAAHAVAWQTLQAFAAGALCVTPEQFDALHAAADRALRERTGGGCAAIHNRLLRYQVLLEQLGRPVGLAPEMSRLYWDTLLNAMRPYPDAVSTMAKLRDMGLVVGVGTNMTAESQYEKLLRIGAMDQVDFIVTSEEVGAEKPDRRLFDMCAEKAGCAAGECLFVGDNPAYDVRGALAAGMRAAWYRPGDGEGAAIPGAATIRRLSELVGLVKSGI